MRKNIEKFKSVLEKENKLDGHVGVLIAFDHLLDLLEEHEQYHRIEIGTRSINREKSNGEVEAAIRQETEFFRNAVHTVIDRTVADLIHKGQKDWKNFYDRVD
jgi:hypothetical protein